MHAPYPRPVLFVECLETQYWVQHLTDETFAALEEWQWGHEMRDEWWDDDEMEQFLESIPGPPRVLIATESAYRAETVAGSVGWIVPPAAPRDTREWLRCVPAPQECCGDAVVFVYETTLEYWSPRKISDISRFSFVDGRIMYDGEVWEFEHSYLNEPSCSAEMLDIRCWMAAERTALFKEELMAKVWHPQSALFKHYVEVDDEI